PGADLRRRLRPRQADEGDRRLPLPRRGRREEARGGGSGGAEEGGRIVRVRAREGMADRAMEGRWRQVTPRSQAPPGNALSGRLRLPAFPGSAWERTALQAPPALLSWDGASGQRQCGEAEPRKPCVPRRSLGTRRSAAVRRGGASQAVRSQAEPGT